MKKIYFGFLAFLLGLGMFVIPAVTQAETEIEAGMVIKGKGLNTLYYIGEDGKRHVFPNDKVYYSWFEDFSEVVEIPLEELYDIPLASNVLYKPGNLLIKIQTDPKVYAVSKNGTLRWIKNEAMARELYGDNWNLLIDDVPDSFFTNYNIGDPVDSSDDYDPEEEEESYPTISHNFGFKAKVQFSKAGTDTERQCNRLEEFVGRVQQRLERFGLSTDAVGADYATKCFSDDSDNDDSTGNTAWNKIKNQIKNRLKWFKNDKITICHQGELNKVTITVSQSALAAHLAHGDSVGSCDATDTDDSDDSDDNDDTDDSDEVEGASISTITITPSTATATIVWTSDKEASYVFQYSDTDVDTDSASSSDETLATSFTVELDNLEPETTYYFVITLTDEDGNKTVSEQYSFTTEAEEVTDTFAPEISNLVVTEAATSTAMTWDTNESALSTLSFSIESLASSTNIITIDGGNYYTSHEFSLTDLATSTEYFYQISVEDEAGNVYETPEDSFTTLAE